MIGTVTILVFLSRVLPLFLVVLPVMLIVTGAYTGALVICGMCCLYFHEGNKGQ